MKRILLIALSLILVFTMFSCGDTNVSTSSENTVSTNENGTLDLKNNRFSVSRENLGNKVNNAFDGDASTFWANGPCNANINEWITVDLGANIDLEKVIIKWGAARANDIKIDICRGGIEYKTVYEGKDLTPKTDEISFEEGTVGRYLKLSMTKCDGQTSQLVGVAVCEIEVYGKKSADTSLGDETQAIIPTKVVEITQENTFVTNKSYEFNYLRWDGSELDFKTTGGRMVGILVECLGNEIELNYSIDGSEFKVLKVTSGEGEYVLADDLEDKPHEVRIVRGSPARQQGVKIKSAIIEDTANLEVGYKREYALKMLILGDSITAGGLDLFTDTYGFKLSELVNAQTIYNAVAGGKVHYIEHNDNIIPEMLNSTEFGKEQDYNFEFQPDIILLSCGVNDRNPWNQNHDLEFRAKFEKEMEETYFNFFCFLHEKMPNAKILYSLSAGMQKIDVVDKVVGTAKKRAVEKYPELVIEMIYMEPKIDVTDGYEDMWHPGEETHERDSHIYAEKVKEMLNLK